MSRQSVIDARADKLEVHGATGAYVAYLAAGLAGSGTVVALTASEERARTLAADIRFLIARPEKNSVLHVPGPTVSPYAELSPDREALGARMAALFQLVGPPELRPSVVVLSAASLTRRVIPAATFANMAMTVRTGGDLDRQDFIERLIQAGYSRTTVVSEHGGFSVRGDVLDVFPSVSQFPLRIELFGDEVEAIRSFDPDSQRTLRSLEVAHVHPVRETVETEGANVTARILEAADRASHPSKATRRLLDAISQGDSFVGVETLTPAFHAEMAPLWQYLPGDATWAVVGPHDIEAVISDQFELAQQRYQHRLEDQRIAFAPNEHYLDFADVAEFTDACRRVEFARLESANAAGSSVRVDVDDLSAVRSALERGRREHAGDIGRPLAERLEAWRGDGRAVILAVSSQSRMDRLRGTLANYDLSVGDADSIGDVPAGSIAFVRGTLSAGFASANDGLSIISEADIFGQVRGTNARQRAAARRAKQALTGGVADFSSLALGDHLVHDVHGVGLYRGLAKLPVGDTPIDFLHVEYRGGTLYLPVYRMGEIQRYVGAEGHTPKLDKLGGVSWATSRARVAKHVQALAEELLQLYAQRAALPGHAFPPADAMYEDFVAAFEFEETPDQAKAISDIEADMERPKPMDRLVCGDVGYGKTEVALRAVLKAALGGKQIALLAPTTVLVEQHYQTMKKRFDGWPLSIARLSRFQSKKQQTEVVLGLARGTVDAVVGTHRLLSKDVRFKDLGLIVIDEEQRFGVAHKERLKRMRAQVDVLTLTATPIPRTLHLAMSGMRDLSIIATPPADRRSIRTFVARPEDGVLREAIRRELERGGQIFFVTPRILAGRSESHRSLDEWAEHLDSVVPGLRIATAHGQMSNDALERAMVGFVDGEYDILVSTTIVESGLDIPRANTMFIADADRFGLSQLYQLRGRIGRSKERAFCYLLVPPPASLTTEARRRLEALQRFTELGAGFSIASQDLEIRGAGELLGTRQSGSIAAVGFDTYIAMLEEAVAELKGQQIHRASDPELNVDDPGYIPDDFVPDTGQRLDLYKRLSAADTSDEVAELLEEISDRYGPRPAEVDKLGELMVLKSHARRLRAQSLELTAGRLALALTESSPIAPGELVRLVGGDAGRFRLTPDMRLLCRLDPDAPESAIEQARAVLLDLVACVTSKT